MPVAGGEPVTFASSFTIGRHPHNSLVIDHPRVSSRHAAIEWDGAAWRLRDLGSSNGTSVNKRRLKAPRRLKVGDVIRFAGASAWKVGQLAAPDTAAVYVPTEGVRGKPDLGSVELHLAFDGPTLGTIRVVHSGGEWSVRTGQRFILLYLLGQRPGEWVEDDHLRQKLWGRAGLHDRDVSALGKLIFDVRKLFDERGVGGWVIEKEWGRTRLALQAERIHVEG